MPTPSPNPWAQGINVLINLAGLGYAYWASRGDAESLFTYQDAPAAVEFRQVQVLFDRTPGVGSAVERELFSLYILNITAGDVDNTWTTGDYTGIEGRLDAWWTAQKTFHTSALKLVGYKWYERALGVPQSGPAVRLTNRSVPGTAATDSLPAQVATSVTLETAHRKHWGRVYLPAHAEGGSDVYGRVLSSVVDAMALNVNNLFANLATDQTYPVVVRNDPDQLPAVKSPLELLTITGIHVDDVPDIIRRRRYQDVLYRKHYP